MKEQSLAYSEVDRKWKAACRMLLGKEMGDLGLSIYNLLGQKGGIARK